MTNTDGPHNQKRSFPWRGVGLFFSILALVILISVFLYSYMELSKINVALAQAVSDLKNRALHMQTDVTVLQNEMAHLQQIEVRTEALAKQQEQTLAEWHAVQQGDVNKWQIVEAQYLVKLANDTLQFTYQYKAAILLLQRADQLLTNLQDAALFAIRQSLAADIARLQTVPDVDITSLFLQLTALNVQLDHLPLPSEPLQPDMNKVMPITASAGVPWWKSAFNQVLQGLSKVVIIRKNIDNTLPLILPEEKTFLYQNIHAQLENAKWAVLHRNQAVYQAGLTRAAVWISQYFDQSQPETKAMLSHLTELLKTTIQPAELNLVSTLQLFDKYFAQVQITA